MGYRYTLRFADGDEAGEAEYSYCPSAGDEIYLSGNWKARVLLVIGEEVASEFVNAPVYGLLEVEPL